jgi:hypothetical protein
MPVAAYCRYAAALAALAAAAVAPAAADASPTLTADRTCYAAGSDLMTFTGGGFTPGAQIGLLFADNGRLGSFSTDADASGAFTAAITAPTFKQFREKPPRFTLGVTANDQSLMGPNGPIGPPEDAFAPTNVTIADWDADVRAWDIHRPKAIPGMAIGIRATGWTTAGNTLYIHYLRAGKAIHTDKVGALTGACGDLTTHIRTFRFKAAKPGRYTVRFTASPKWNSKDPWTGYDGITLR